MRSQLISRRSFLHGAALGGVCLSSLLAACAAPSAPPAGTTTAAAPAAPTNPVSAPTPQSASPASTVAAAAAPTTAPAETSATGTAPTKPTAAELIKSELNLSDFKSASIDWQQAKGTELTMWIVQGGEFSDPYLAMPSLFNELTGIKVNVQDLPYQTWLDKLAVELPSRAGNVDVVLTETRTMIQYANGKTLEPLDAYFKDASVTDPKWFDLQDILAGPLGVGQYQNVQYGIPTYPDTTLLSYRKDIFDQKPDTLDDLLAQAQKANSPATAGITMRGIRSSGENVYVFTGFLRALGGDFFAKFPDDMHPTVNSPEAVQALQLYADMLSKYGPPGQANYDENKTVLAAQQGKAASLIEWGGHPTRVDNKYNSPTTVGKWAYAQVPQGKNGRWPASNSWLMSMNAASKKDKKASWLLVSFLTSKPFQRFYSLVNLPALPRASLGKDASYTNTLKDAMGDPQGWLTEYAQAHKTANPDYLPRFPQWGEFGDRLSIAVQGAIAGEQDPKSALAAAQEDLQTMMQKYKYIT